MNRQRFQLGLILITRGVELIFPGDRLYLQECLSRHQCGDFGIMDDHDRQANEDAVKYGNRILSAYPIDPTKPCKGWGENCIWIITERDRSVTTILLPEEY